MGFVTHGELMERLATGTFNALRLGGLVVLAGAIALMFRRPEYALYFVGISFASVFPIVWWFTRRRRKGLPVLPLFVLQQAAVYLMPLFMENPTLERYSSGIIGTSAASLALFLLLLPAGWVMGFGAMHSRPSRWNMKVVGRDGGRAMGMGIALVFLSIGFVIDLLSFAGLLYKVLPLDLQGLLPVIRTFSAAASTIGALAGGYVVALRGGSSHTVYYWILFAGIAVLSISGVLISAATALVVASASGQVVGGRRVPWVFLTLTLGIVGFLNLGKFTMRERYWSTMGSKTTETKEQVSLIDLPEFYVEWVAASMEKIWIGQEVATNKRAIATEDEGASLLNRIDNFQNMAFVVNAQLGMLIRPLWGETYALIPPLFIPRIFWANKPRTHEGQIRLNLHYGRQGSIEDTSKTYIAWGLLPEAVGNFGIWLGPVILGPVLGFSFGLLEAWSRRKRVFSIEGLIAAGLALQVLVSFEMVASLLLTSTFQMVIAVALGGFALRVILPRL